MIRWTGLASELPLHLFAAAFEGLTPGLETVVLVTGASSWVGAYIAKSLVDAGFSVSNPPLSRVEGKS